MDNYKKIAPPKKKRSKKNKVKPSQEENGSGDRALPNGGFELRERSHGVGQDNTDKISTSAAQNFSLAFNVDKIRAKLKAGLRNTRRKEVKDPLNQQDIVKAGGGLDQYDFTNFNVRTDNSTSNRALITYLSDLSKSDHQDDIIDLDFVAKLIQDGADPNCTDVYGQSAMHEVARIWEVDVAAFMLDLGCNINQGDKYGRTPLHVAAAVDYTEMITFLLDNGADIEACTNGENHTPVHFAARNDARDSLRILVKCKGDINARDYKGRTPLQIAAELDRSETAKLLIELGAKADVFDHSDQAVLSFMISKMPPVAKEALDQFHHTDRANRKQYFDLHNLECDKTQIPKTPFDVVVEYGQLDLITHPVFQELMEVKWKRFAMWGVILQLISNLVFILLWTAVAIIEPGGGRDVYRLPEDAWRIALEGCALLFTFYQILTEILEYRNSKKKFEKWKEWRLSEIERDISYCHPRWPQEKKYLLQEIDEIEKKKPQYFSEFWNYFDWFVYLLLMACVIMCLIDDFVDSNTNEAGEEELTIWSERLLAITIIFVWVRLMKTVRAFSFLGPFIVMLTHMMKDCVKFLFLYLQFYIPYACAFWMIFGNKGVAGYNTVDELLYSLFRITLVDDYHYDDLSSQDRLMAYILCASFLAISAIVFLNLFIALMSDTFQRVYDNARSNAAMERAQIILTIEDGLSEKKKQVYRDYINTNCGPEEKYYDDDVTIEGGDELKKVTIQIKEELDELKESLYGHFGIKREDLDDMRESIEVGGINDVKGSLEETRSELTTMIKKQDKVIEELRQDVKLLLGLLKKKESEVNNKDVSSHSGSSGSGDSGGAHTEDHTNFKTPSPAKDPYPPPRPLSPVLPSVSSPGRPSSPRIGHRAYAPLPPAQETLPPLSRQPTPLQSHESIPDIAFSPVNPEEKERLAELKRRRKQEILARRLHEASHHENIYGRHPADNLDGGATSPTLSHNSLEDLSEQITIKTSVREPNP